jgi:hypothetical protein
MPFLGQGQNLDLGSWNILNIKYNYNEKLSVFGEAQLRSLKFYTNYHYYEYKGGINYKIHKNVKLTLGAGSYQTYMEDGDFVLPKKNDEFRVWPQIVLFQLIGKLKIEQRYRAEFRLLLTLLERKAMDTSLFKLVLAMSYFLQTKNLFLNETECYFHLTLNHQKQQLYKLVICTSSITK